MPVSRNTSISAIAQTFFPGKSLLWTIAAFLAGFVAFAWSGDVSLGPTCFVEAITRLMSAWCVPAAYMLSASGLGRALAQLLLPSKLQDTYPNGPAFSLGLGLAAQLTISHALGMFGAFAQNTSWWIPFSIALGALVPGLVLRYRHSARTMRTLRSGGEYSRPWFLEWNTTCTRICAVLFAFLAGLLCAASVSTPGVLWRSEFGGFDALSYHLQLPQEWILAGRIAPLDNNVYSYLPSYLEAAFTHLAVSWPQAASATNPLLEGGGIPIFTAQVFHALIAVLAAMQCGSVARAIVSRLSVHRCHPDIAAWVTTLAVLATPWAIVTGSLAYNDMGVVLMFAAAVLVSLETNISPLRRTIAAAIIIGAACGIKPTALLFTGIPTGIVLLATFPRERWLKHAVLCASVGSIVGLLMLAPWMARNYHASGNPVFPFAASIFAKQDGSMGHWSAEQVTRFGRSHHFDGSLADRVRLTVLPDPHDPSGKTHRGLAHPQWGITALGGICICFGLLLWTSRDKSQALRARVAVLLLCAALSLQVILWLFTTHIQSRFLIPCLLPLAVAWGIAAGAFFHTRPIFATLLPIVLFALNAVLAVPSMGLTSAGTLFLPTHVAGDAAFQKSIGRKDWTAQQVINLVLTKSDHVLLLGDTAPLYFDPQRTTYATTWDKNPFVTRLCLATSKTSSTTLPPSDTWSTELKRVGYTHLLINFAELNRLKVSGFLDPAIDPEQVSDWAQTMELVQAWPHTGQVLIKLR